MDVTSELRTSEIRSLGRSLPWRLAAAFAVGAAAAAGLAAPAAAEQPEAEKRQQSSNPGPQKGGKPGAKPGAKPEAKPGAKPAAQPPGKGGGRRAMAVGVDAVISGPLQETAPVIGRIVGREGGVISARSPGPVEEIRVHVGDRVKKGQILATLVTETLKAQLALQEAELRLAQQELSRLERLRSNKSAAFPRARYDDALQKVAKAEANLRIAKLALNYAYIRAPYPGVITKRHTEAGAFLRQGDQVVTMVNDRAMELEADVPISRISGLTPGREVVFELTDDRKFKARVRAIVPEQNSLTRTVAVRFTAQWDLTKVHAAINQNVTLHIPVGQARMAVSVHKDAIINRGAAKMVFVVMKKPDGGMVAAPRMVRLGEAVGSRFVVERGLKPGDLVIVRGNERVRPGMAVRPLRRGS